MANAIAMDKVEDEVKNLREDNIRLTKENLDLKVTLDLTESSLESSRSEQIQQLRESIKETHRSVKESAHQEQKIFYHEQIILKLSSVITNISDNLLLQHAQSSKLQQSIKDAMFELNIDGQ